MASRHPQLDKRVSVQLEAEIHGCSAACMLSPGQSVTLTTPRLALSAHAWPYPAFDESHIAAIFLRRSSQGHVHYCCCGNVLRESSASPAKLGLRTCRRYAEQSAD